MTAHAIKAPIDGTLITRAAFVPEGKPFQACVRCVMDTTDPLITFDDDGVCNHCHYFDTVIKQAWPSSEHGAAALASTLQRIKASGEGKRYDCIIGLSGGVDSSYLAIKAVEWKLRPLVVHVDAGWNSELAVMNIEQICRRLGLDLLTHVVDWEEFQDVQRAFLKSNLANQDAPQDHVFYAALTQHAQAEGIRYIISGSNFATESILPQAWGYDAMDSTLLRAVHRQYGERPIKKFPVVRFGTIYPLVHKSMEVIAPLNFIEYSKQKAIETLESGYGWRYYGGKHYESRWTRFFQAFYLPYKFGYDKRKAHLSSLVVSGQMTRDAAMAELSRPLYEPAQLNEDKAFIAKKLAFTTEELDALIDAPPRRYDEFPNFQAKLRRYRTFSRVRGVALRILRRIGLRG